MQIGIIGLGRMCANMTRRLIKGSHECIVYDSVPAAVTAMVQANVVGASSFEDLTTKLTPPRAKWLMVPAAAMDNTAPGDAAFQDKLLSAMRFGFGGHVEKTVSGNK